VPPDDDSSSFESEKDILDEAFSEADDAEDSSEDDDDDDEREDDPEDEGQDFGTADADDDDDESDDSSDEDDDDEDDDDDDEDDETPAERRAREAEEKLAQITEDRKREVAEAEAVKRGEAVVSALLQRRNALDADDEANGRAKGTSWAAFQNTLLNSFKDTVIKQQAQALRGAASQQLQTREQQKEEQVFQYLYNQVTERLKPNRTEDKLLLRSRTPEEFEEAVNTILDDRGERTRPAREAKAKRVREDRKARGADRTGVRGNGGAAKPKATRTFKNVDDALDADFTFG
jgi:hypothetical protein